MHQREHTEPGIISWGYENILVNKSVETFIHSPPLTLFLMCPFKGIGYSFVEGGWLSKWKLQNFIVAFNLSIFVLAPISAIILMCSMHMIYQWKTDSFFFLTIYNSTTMPLKKIDATAWQLLDNNNGHLNNSP